MELHYFLCILHQENDEEPSGMPSLLEHFRGEEIIAVLYTENRAFVGALFSVWVVAGATGNGRNWCVLRRPIGPGGFVLLPPGPLAHG